MKKLTLIGVDLCTVVLLILGLLSNVVGYQTVQASQQSIIQERINQRELLLQTLIDSANNKEIQRTILNSQISRGMFPVSNIPSVTKNQIKQMFFIGLIFSKFISKSRIQSIIEKHQFNNQDIHKQINGVIEQDTKIKEELTLLLYSDCDCEYEIKEEKIAITDFSDTPILCEIVMILFLICIILLTPFTLIEEGFQNTIFEPLANLFLLITFPTSFSIVIIALLSLYLCWHFNCVNFSPPH